MGYEFKTERAWVHAGRYGWLPLDLVVQLGIESDIYGNDVITFKLSYSDKGEKYKSNIVFGSKPG